VKSKKSSRRGVLQKAVLSALLSAAPLSIIEAATSDGQPRAITLEDGSRLIIKKVGENEYLASREEGGKVVDAQPTGTFKGTHGQIVVVNKGRVKSAKSAPGVRSDWFLEFNQ
jgi:hypothetical protein